MEGEELPPVVAVFKADIAEFMAKVEEVKLALDSIGSRRTGFARVEADAAAARREIDSGVRRSLDDAARAADNVGRSSERAAQTSTTAWDRWLARMKTMFPEVVDRYHASVGELQDINSEAAQKLQADFRRAFQQIVDRDARDAFQRIIAHTDEADRDWKRWLHDMESLFPGVTEKWNSSLARFKAENENATAKMEQDYRQAFQKIAERDARAAFDRMIRDSEQAGDRAGRGFWGRFGAGGNSMFAGLAPGGRRPNWGALLGGLLPILSPAAAGLLTPVVSGLETLTPALAGSAVSAVFAKDAFGEVTKAAATLETQTNKYNTAADNTARFLQSDTNGMATFKDLLTQVTGPQADVLQLLTKQDVTWGSLTTTQQNAVIGIRDTQDLYKALAQSQKDQINALLAEKAAWDKLEPNQQQALTNYQGMKKAYDDLRTAAMPSMFGTIASAEQAAADALKPLLPVIQESARGWSDLFTKLDGWFNSPDYQKFTDMWSSTARGTIDAIGTAIGNVALGFIHMWEALSPMIGPSESWLKTWSAGFANWANTPKGMADLQHFMEDLRKDGPPTWQALSNIAHFAGELIAALAGNPLSMQVLADISGFLRSAGNWKMPFTHWPIGKWIIDTTAWALAIYKLAQSFGALALAQKLLGGSAAGSAASAAAGAGGLNLLTAGEARALGVTGAGAVAGDTAAVGEGAAAGGIMARITGALGGVGAGLAGLGAPGIAALLGVPLIVGGIAYYEDKVHQASDRAKGVIEDSSGRMSAAWSVGGEHLSQGFHDLVNTIRDQTQTTGTTVAQSGNMASTRFGLYREDWSKGNTAVLDALYLGRTQFGQSAGLFAHDFGYNVAEMGASLKKQGKTLNEVMLSSLQSVFTDTTNRTKAYWKGFEDTMVQGLDTFFAKQRTTTKNDYDALQAATKQYEDDNAHGRIANAKKDSEALSRAVQQYEDDYNNGLISNSDKNMKKLSADLAKYMNDLATGNSAAWKGDIDQLGRDTVKNFGNMTDSVDANTSHRFDQEIAQSQADITRIMTQMNNDTLNALPGGHAQGGFISGPGTGTSDSILARLSNGEFVVNAQSTAEHRPLLEAINSRFATGGYVNPAGPRAVGDQATYIGDIGIRLAAQAAAVAAAASSAGVSGQVAQWIAQGMRAAGVSGADWASGLGIIIKYESGGNPRAINLSDSNAAMGDPSRGLMQTIGSTFNAYHVPGTSSNIYDPVANIAAGISYIEHVYGGIDNVPGVRSIRHGGGYLPYDNGGWLMPGVTAALNMTGKPEAVFTQPQLQALMEGRGEVVIPIKIQMDGKTVWESTRRVNLQQQRRNGKSTYTYGDQRIL